MSEFKKHKNLVNESEMETYQVSLENRISQFVQIADDLPSKCIREVIGTLEKLLKNKPISSDLSSFLLNGLS